MQAKVICLASAKGGSGKTILTTSFGAFLAALGKKVLLVDTDAATNGLSLFHLKEVRTQLELAIGEGREAKGAYEITPANPFPEVVDLGNNLHLVPATYAFANTETRDFETYRTAIEAMMATVRPSYDFILVDAQAGSDLYAQVSMSRAVSDEVIIVSEYDPMSAAGVERLKGLFREELTYVRTWVLLNKMLPEFVQSFSDFLEVAKYLSPIPWDADVVRAYARRRVALDVERGNDYTLAVIRTLRSLLGEDISAEIDEWMKGRASAIREPIEEQYHDVEMELEGLMYEGKRAQAKKLQRRFIAMGLVGVLFSCLFGFLTVIAPMKEMLDHLFPGSRSDPFKYLFILIPVLLSLAYMMKEQLFVVFSRYDSEQARLNRQREILEERLKRLEALRQADPETLVTSKGSTKRYSSGTHRY